MPEHIRALVVILVIATAVFVVIRVPMSTGPCSPEDFKRRRNAWYFLTLSAFLAHNFWLFIFFATIVLVYALKTEPNRYALYLGLMLTLPSLSAEIPGLGIVNQIFAVDQLRLLAFVILLPEYLRLRGEPGVKPFGSLWCDRVLICLLGLEVILNIPHRSITHLVRDSILYPFTGIFLTYYVASRSLKTVDQFRDAICAFLVGAMVLCCILFFESQKNWLLYRTLDDALGVVRGFGGIYLRRSGILRAEGTAGQSIIAGYTCAVAMGLFLYISTKVKSKAWRAACWLILIAGIIGALSRGPWLGAALMVVTYLLLGPGALVNLLKLAVVLIVGVSMLVFTGLAPTIVDFLPWVGTVDSASVAGREHLAEVALRVIAQNPWTGYYEFGELPALEVLRDGSGMIDLVNTYIIVALKGGVFAFLFFVTIPTIVMLGILAQLWGMKDWNDERHSLGRALFATLAGVLFIIATVSPIFFIYPIYWALVGLSVGYVQMMARQPDRVATRSDVLARPLPGQGQKWFGRARQIRADR